MEKLQIISCSAVRKPFFENILSQIRTMKIARHVYRCGKLFGSMSCKAVERECVVLSNENRMLRNR